MTTRLPQAAAIPVLHIMLLVLLMIVTPPSQAAQVVRVDRIVMTVSDLARTEAFYRDGLGFERVSLETRDSSAIAALLGLERAKHQALVMRLGDELVEFDQFEKPGRPYPADSRSPDLWFQHFAIVVADMPRAYQRLRLKSRFKTISDAGPQTLPDENGRVQAFKFRDPDGHPLELLHFPAGQGRELWRTRAADGRLFLGIDHSAISIDATPSSLAFYCGRLGMQSVYSVINRGPTQQHLDGTFNAVVEITGVRGSDTDGPGIEFLDYRTPPSGRRARPDVAANDIEHIYLRLQVDDLALLEKALFEARVPEVSPGIVSIDPAVGESRNALMVLDPDGHRLMLMQ